MVRIGIVGSRKFFDCKFVKQCFLEVLKEESLDLNSDNIILISGGAIGVDTCAQEIAKEFGLTIVIVYPNWKRYGKSAGMIRNSKIVEYSDIIIAIPKSDSVGTLDTIHKAKQSNKKLYQFNVP